MNTVIRITNFRSINSTTFTITPGINALVGSNGSGKTNLLHALKFLSNLVNHGAALAMGKAGGPARNFRRNARNIKFSITGGYGSTLYKNKRRRFYIRWDIEISIVEPQQIVQISQESLRVLADMGGGSFEEVFSAEVSRVSASGARQKTLLADDSLLTKKFIEAPQWVHSSAKKEQVFKIVREKISEGFRGVKNFPLDGSIIDRVSPLHGSIRKLVREIRSIDEYSIIPEIARQASDPLPAIRMGNDGFGVSEVINALETQQFRRIGARSIYPYQIDSPHYFGNTLDVIRFNKKNPIEEIVEHLSAGVGSVDGITTDIDPSTGRRYVVFKSELNRFRPEEVSDGTIKWLCLLVALLVPQMRVMLLEEPENFMHPWMQQRLVMLAREQAKRSGASVIISTHSVTVLNALEIGELLLVHQVDGATQVDKVGDPKALQSVLDSSNFGLGDIWVSGGIGAVPGAVP